MTTQREAKKVFRYCLCSDRMQTGIQGMCKFGNCVEFTCSRCGLFQSGWGPMGCACENGGHYMRPWYYPHMCPHPTRGLKPSIRSQRRHQKKH